MADNKKGPLSLYLDRNLTSEALAKERKKQLARISNIRKRPILVMAADLNKSAITNEISITYKDISCFHDLLAGLEGEAIDVLIETPGGSAEVAEDLVRLLRNRFKTVDFIIPGWAKSAGTIMAMAGNNILMGPTSALGPIDAQMQWNNKIFSAVAFLKHLENIKNEADNPQKGLNRAYIPILQQISPGEIQTALNALDFAKNLVAEWLRDYKFSDWKTHNKTGVPVTDDEREETANKIAEELCDHQKWLTHNRGIKIQDLEKMGLQIIDYSNLPSLNDPIRKYHALLYITFESNAFKLFETKDKLISRFLNAQVLPQQIQTPIVNADAVDADIKCPHCQGNIPIQMKFKKGVLSTPGRIPYPKSGIVSCPHCRAKNNLAGVRQQIEQNLKRKVVPS